MLQLHIEIKCVEITVPSRITSYSLCEQHHLQSFFSYDYIPVLILTKRSIDMGGNVSTDERELSLIFVLKTKL